MMFICGERLAEDRLQVSTRHYMPELLTQDKLDTGYLVENIPEPSIIIGKEATLYFNPQTQELWYEYIDRPLTDAEELVKQVNDLNLAIAAIIGGAV